MGYFKETEGGRREMCEIWEEIKQKGIIEGEARGEARGEMKGMVKSIQKLMIKKDYTLEEALNFFDIPEEERPIYIQRIISYLLDIVNHLKAIMDYSLFLILMHMS